MKWNSKGCFNEHKRPAKRVLGLRFATIKGINNANPDIEKVFNMCSVAAEKKGYKIFGIRVRRNSEMFFIHFFVTGLYVILSYRKLARDDKGKLLVVPEWSVFWKTEHSRIKRKRSEFFAIFFIQYWGILISLRFASFVTPRITSTKT